MAVITMYYSTLDEVGVKNASAQPEGRTPLQLPYTQSLRIEA